MSKGGGITSYKPSEFARTRLLQELELVFKEFCKAKEIESSRDSIPYAKLQHHDPEKWKKKFKMLFEREKIVSFGKQGCIVDFRRIKFSPCQQDGPLPQIKPLKSLGRDVLSLPKFWVLLLTLAKVESLEQGLYDLSLYLTESAEAHELLKNFLPIQEQRNFFVEEVDEVEEIAEIQEAEAVVEDCESEESLER